MVLTRNESRDVNKNLFENIAGLVDSDSDIARLARGDEVAYTDAERPIVRKFQNEILPEIAHRFGRAGLLDSSSFEDSIADASRTLQQDLVDNRSKLRSNALSQLLQTGKYLAGTQDTLFPEGSDAGVFSSGLGAGLSRIAGRALGGTPFALADAVASWATGRGDFWSTFGRGIGSAVGGPVGSQIGAGLGPLLGAGAQYFVNATGLNDIEVIKRYGNFFREIAKGIFSSGTPGTSGTQEPAKGGTPRERGGFPIPTVPSLFDDPYSLGYNPGHA